MWPLNCIIFFLNSIIAETAAKFSVENVRQSHLSYQNLA